MELKINQVIDSRYKIISKEGKGATSLVYKVLDLTNNAFKALKILTTAKNVDAAFKKEAGILSSLNFEHYVTPIDDFGIFTFENENYPYMVLEFYPNKTIQNIASTNTYLLFSNNELEYYFKRILLGLKGIHDNQVTKMIHKDLKPQNILLNAKWDPFIADFGISQVLQTEKNTLIEASGTPKYMAPELFLENNYDKNINQPYYIDIYAIGVMLYAYSTGMIPFENFDVIDYPEQTHKKEIATRDLNLWMDLVKPSVYNPEINRALENVILRAMAKDYHKRYQTLNELMDDFDQIDNNNFKPFEDYNTRPKNIEKPLVTYVSKFNRFLKIFNWKWLVMMILILLVIVFGFALVINLV